MAATCRFAAPLGLAPLPRSCAGAKSVAFSMGTTKVAPRTRSVAVRAGDGPAETPEILKAAQDAVRVPFACLRKHYTVHGNVHRRD